jgi:nucleoside-diphosphate-sugar epimerase
MAKKVMVVGGTGNMSTGIVRLLVTRGYDVSIFCRGASLLPPHPDVRVIRGDRTDRQKFVETMRGGSYDYAIDMICWNAADAEDDVAAFPDVERLVFCSSGAAYGALPATEMPIREDYVSGSPVWAYGLHKRRAEDYFMERFFKNGYPITIIRPTVTFGRQKTLIRQIGADNSWIDRIRKGKPIVTGNPYLLRNFLHADDAAWAFVGALEHSACIGQRYNMVGLKPYDWGAYHRAMMRVLGRETETVEVTLDTLLALQTPEFPIGEMITENFKYNGFYCGEKIARDIPEFGQSISLEEGLRRAVAFAEEHGAIPDSDKLRWEDDVIRAQKTTYAG